jgi:hypothetical protein
MDCPTIIAILVIALIGVGLGLINYAMLFRQEMVTTAALVISLRYQYPTKIVLYNLEAQEEMWREIDERLCKQTEKLHAEFLEAHRRLGERFRWDPFKNSLLNRRVFDYELARNKLLAANEAGPLKISVCHFIYPDFLSGNCRVEPITRPEPASSKGSAPRPNTR